MKTIIFLTCIVIFITQSVGNEIPCTTPNNLAGNCVPIEKCAHLFASKQLYQTSPNPRESDIRNATCNIEASTMGVCCATEKIFELPEKCGLSDSNRIANGNETEMSEFAWMALLMYRDLDSNEVDSRCSGSLISVRYVVTAAHCLPRESEGRDSSKLEFVRLGEHIISTNPDCVNFTELNGYFEEVCADPVEDVAVESYVIHPDYRKSFIGDDIGLIRLAEAIVFKTHISPICLPMSEELKDSLLPNYIVAGWGYTQNMEPSDVLMKALLPRIDREACQQWFNPYKKMYNIKISERQICAGAVGLVDACAGDSGGPLMWATKYKAGLSRYVLFGVVSYGVESCGVKDLPGLYTRVGSYLEWILNNMKA
ncbi:serine protease grass-like [Armigeres subalbatus]|uniref:serine protease grass-like n=1 Tax=Armigeres subalbatus TaxID=124917 RepID=UPI002ED1FCF3